MKKGNIRKKKNRMLELEATAAAKISDMSTSILA